MEENNSDEEVTDEAETFEPPTYDVPIVLNESVENHIEYFQVRIRDQFEQWLTRSGRYLPLMREVFKSFELPEDLVYVALIESGFNPYAYSRSRAVGPWQFMAFTGRKYGLRIDYWIDERRDPIKSTIAAARYLKDLYNMFGSWPLALASYNAGEGRVMRALTRSKADDFWALKTTRYLRPETRNYVPKFMAATIIAKNPEKYGFSLTYPEPLRFDEVVIDGPTDLRVIADAAEVTYEEVKELNPELRRGMTPINYKDYVLKLPFGTKDTFIERFREVPVEKRTIWLRHRVVRGETISSIARRYRTTVKDVQEINRFQPGKRLRLGEYVLIPMKTEKVATKKPQTTAVLRTEKADTPRDTPRMIYRVRRGDTLWNISSRYGVSVNEIRRWNRLPGGDRIRVGQRLVLHVDDPDT